MNLPNLTKARVIADYGEQLLVSVNEKQLRAEPSGKLLFDAAFKSDLPKVGDWVNVNLAGDDFAIIHEVLPRKNQLSRKNPGKIFEEQVLAANIDVVFIVTGLDHDFNVRRIERYLTAVSSLNARVILILNKADLLKEKSEIEAALQNLIGISKILYTTAFEETDIQKIKENILEKETAIFIGSSGVGKSTLLNGLLGGEFQKTAAVRADDSRGRHTTTHRELFVLENEKFVIDTPGMREMALWDNSDSLENSFEDIENLIQRCKFKNCIHETEPGCAVKTALEKGELDTARYESYLKQKRELEYLESKVNPELFQERKNKWKKIHQSIKEIYKRKYPN
jgi:ribosome biogenesis GTPase